MKEMFDIHGVKKEEEPPKVEEEKDSLEVIEANDLKEHNIDDQEAKDNLLISGFTSIPITQTSNCLE